MSNQSTREGVSIELDAETYALLEAHATSEMVSIEAAFVKFYAEFMASPRGQALSNIDHPEHASTVAKMRAEIEAAEEFDRLTTVARRAYLN